MKISKENGEHYQWGDNCDGWHLLQERSLSIIHERMPPGTEEVRHYHQEAGQFFFNLIGTTTIEMDGNRFELKPFEGLEIPKQTPHQVFNRSDSDIEFLVISQPPTKGDRVVL